MSNEMLTRGGTPWEPTYLTAIDGENCLGCGRCFKVCGRDVLAMQGLDEDGEVCEDEGDIERYVMTISNADDCIGCGSCARVCARNCQTHAKASELVAA